MCRFLAYLGDPVLMEHVICTPSHSLIQQSLHANQSKTPINGDGFGLGWYGERKEPGLYRDLRPAWSDDNLLSICSQVRSKLFFAHVRAATGTATARANCHPFSHHGSMFMHNGQIGGFTKIRRAIEAMIPDDLYSHRSGTTDSEAIYLAALAQGACDNPAEAFGLVLTRIRKLMTEAGIEEALRFAAAFTDGATIHAFRWACDAKAPTLYWRREDTGIHIVSEPFDETENAWSSLPQGSMLIASASGAVDMQTFDLPCA